MLKNRKMKKPKIARLILDLLSLLHLIHTMWTAINRIEFQNSKPYSRINLFQVKFNLIPTVHTMVKWNYAYRAARQGPWEEMARDRDRFKQRINCIATVLNPILTNQHRYNVWEKRFAPQISVSDYVWYIFSNISFEIEKMAVNTNE